MMHAAAGEQGLGHLQHVALAGKADQPHGLFVGGPAVLLGLARNDDALLVRLGEKVDDLLDDEGALLTLALGKDVALLLAVSLEQGNLALADPRLLPLLAHGRLRLRLPGLYPALVKLPDGTPRQRRTHQQVAPRFSAVAELHHARRRLRISSHPSLRRIRGGRSL